MTPITLTEDECNFIYYCLGDELALDGDALATYEALRERIGRMWDERFDTRPKEPMKTYAVELVGLLKVTAHVRAESPERATEIAWNGEQRPGESVEYQQRMQCLEFRRTVGRGRLRGRAGWGLTV